jgi:hypothetical protein
MDVRVVMVGQFNIARGTEPVEVRNSQPTEENHVTEENHLVVYHKRRSLLMHVT